MSISTDYMQCMVNASLARISNAHNTSIVVTEEESITQRERRQSPRQPLHPTNQRSWFDASHESAHSAGIS